MLTHEEYWKTANRHVFIDQVHNLSLPVLVACSAANRTVGAAGADYVTVTGADAELMIKAARQLEDAAAALRSAARIDLAPALIQAVA